MCCKAEVMACGQALAWAIYRWVPGLQKRQAVHSWHNFHPEGSAFSAPSKSWLSRKVGLVSVRTRMMQVGMSVRVDALAASCAESRSLGCLRHHQHRTGLTNLRQHCLLANAQLTSEVLSSSGQLRGCRVYERQPARVHSTITCQATPLDVRLILITSSALSKVVLLCVSGCHECNVPAPGCAGCYSGPGRSFFKGSRKGAQESSFVKFCLE